LSGRRPGLGEAVLSTVGSILTGGAASAASLLPLWPQASPRQAPDRWIEIECGNLRSVCLPELKEPLQAIYDAREWVFDSLARRPDAFFFRGRQPVVAGIVGTAKLVVKRMFHGGALAPLIRDRFLSSRRVRSHVENAEFLTSHAVATAPVAFTSWRRVNGLVRSEVGFHRIEGSQDADSFFFGETDPAPDWERQAGDIGRLVGRLHQIGFLHADLNLMNFLIGGDGELYILDLDNASLRNRACSTSERRRNLLRLERSIRKQGRARPAGIVEQIIARFRAAYLAA
jgi:hypothetical protein